MGVLFFAVQSAAQSLPVEEEAGLTKKSITLTLYPNPSDGEFRVEMNLEEKGVITAKLFDMTGKLVEDLSSELNYESGKVSGDIKLEELNPGIYFLRVENGRRSGAKKIVIR